MNCGKFSKIKPFKSCKTINSDSLIFSDNDYFSCILAELEATNDGTHLNLVFEDDGI